jgi:2-polyprenyl-3-methyl-5-hydroxy-6-metoxy-1,4-benzoquinol methylase
VSRYETAIDLDNPNNSQTQLITLVGRDKFVLDVGCAAGDTAEALVARGCTVSGVDIDADAAEPARAVLDELVIADIDRNPLSEHFKAESFDAIIFGDVLEHLVDPWATLRDAATLLRPEGRILVSIPNVAHAAVRLALLQGNWDYTEKGLLDRTHLRFFTLETVCELLESADLQIEVLRSTVLDPMATQEITVDADLLPSGVIEWVRQQPDALNYQYVAAARPLAADEERRPRPPLEPALSYDEARLRDRHTEQLLQEREERHRVLTLRDHVIGLEANAASADARTGRMRARAKQAERRFRKLRNELDAVADELARITTSRRPRTHLRALTEKLRSEARKLDSEIPKDDA